MNQLSSSVITIHLRVFVTCYEKLLLNSHGMVVRAEGFTFSWSCHLYVYCLVIGGLFCGNMTNTSVSIRLLVSAASSVNQLCI